MRKKFFHLSGKVIDSDSDIDEAFKFMDQSIMTKQKVMLVKTELS